MAKPGKDFLADICADTLKDVEGRKVRRPQSLLDERVGSAPTVRSLSDAIVGDEVAVIAEFKRASPSRGVIREDADPGEIGRIYGENGASAMSVLTNSTYFQGRERDLVVARANHHLPALRKDFILDAYQIDEARSVGADAVLLIVAALTDQQLTRFASLSHALGMDAVVEAHDEEEVRRAVGTGAKIIGINNRNLHTFEVSLDTTTTLRKLVPKGVIVISESGISSREDVERLAQSGIDAILVGESLMASDDIASSVQSLVGVSKA